MLILPLHKKPTRRNFPVITVALILVNLFVYTVFQGNDHDRHHDALSHYHDSGLSDQEWAWFEDFIPREDAHHQVQIREVNELEEAGADGLLIASYRSSTVSSHPDFLELAREGEFLDPDSEAWREWADARDEFERLHAQIFTEQHLLSYHELNPSGLLMHMFMHGSLMHLIGNMVFLAALGLLVEGALGRRLFLASYLLAGLGAAGLAMALNWGLPGGMLGASGAVAGLMGLYAVLYGRRRVRFFYWFFVYFDYVRAPAIVLLPAWLGWELLQFFVAESNIAYEAHIGGIASGALLALGVRQAGLERQEFMDEDIRREDDRAMLKEAREAVTQLQPDQARNLLRPLLARHPEDPDVLGTWYAACKLRSKDSELHDAMEHILTLDPGSPQRRRLIMATLRDYLNQPQARVDEIRLLELAHRLARLDALDEASEIIDRLLADGYRPQGLAETCLVLGRRLRFHKAVSQAETLLELAEKHADRPAIRRAARELLGKE